MQDAPPDYTWPFPGAYRSLGHALIPQAMQETQAQLNALKAQGIDRVETGLEIEMMLSRDAKEAYGPKRQEIWIKEDLIKGLKKKSVLKGIEQQTPEGSLEGERKAAMASRAALIAETEALKNELKQLIPADADERFKIGLAKLTESINAMPEGDRAKRERARLKKVRCPRELVMLELIHEMPDALEVPKSLYDGQGTLEAVFHKTDPFSMLRHQEEFIHRLHEKMAYYGLSFQRSIDSLAVSYFPGIDGACNAHVSFSFWKQDKNVMDAANSEFRQEGKRIIEGMAAAAQEAFPCLTAGYQLKDARGNPDKFFMLQHEPIQVSPSRSTTFRLARGRIEYRAQDSHEYQNLPLMLPVLLAGAAYGLAPEDKAYHRAHVLQATEVQRCVVPDEQGSLKCTRHALNGAVIEKSGGWLQKPHYRLVADREYVRQRNDQIAKELGLDDSSREPLEHYFNRVRLERQKDGGFTCEWPEYPEGTGTPPHRLREQIPRVSAVPSYTIQPGYPASTKADAWQDDVIRLMTGKILEERFSPSFLASLREEARQRYPIEPPQPEMEGERTIQPANARGSGAELK